jgi:hypothetical protein
MVGGILVTKVLWIFPEIASQDRKEIMIMVDLGSLSLPRKSIFQKSFFDKELICVLNVEVTWS